MNNKGVRNADVYYYGPNSKKLRSLKEVQLLLNVLPEDYSLTIDNFTFTKFPIGVNDESKELIRDANDRFLKVIKTLKFYIYIIVNHYFWVCLYYNLFLGRRDILDYYENN